MIDRYIAKSVTAWLTSKGSQARCDALIDQVHDGHTKVQSLSEGRLDRGDDQGAIHDIMCGTGYERSKITRPVATQVQEMGQQSMHDVSRDVHSQAISFTELNAPSTQKGSTTVKKTGSSPPITVDRDESGGAVTEGGTSSTKSIPSTTAQALQPYILKHSQDNPRNRAQTSVRKAGTKILISHASPVPPEYGGEPEILLMNQSSSPRMDNLNPESAAQAHSYAAIGSQNVCCD
jgi:hypothetical protein